MTKCNECGFYNPNKKIDYCVHCGLNYFNCLAEIEEKLATFEYEPREIERLRAIWKSHIQSRDGRTTV